MQDRDMGQSPPEGVRCRRCLGRAQAPAPQITAQFDHRFGWEAIIRASRLNAHELTNAPDPLHV